jgi:GNAT superfamily N-acetyltransferase
MSFEIVTGYLPGSIGRIAELHADYYHAHCGFGLYFESKVATELAEFLRRYDDTRDGLWLARVDGRIEGSVAMDGIHAAEEGAHLRWFIVSGRARGGGLGNALLDAALGFCSARGYQSIYLWTFAGLHAARHLYEKRGFRLAREHRGTQWGAEVNEQRFELRLPVGATASVG